MTYTICNVSNTQKDRKGNPKSIPHIFDISTLTDARKEAYTQITREHSAHISKRVYDRPIKKEILKNGVYLGKTIWCPKCERILWNNGKEWYTLTKNGRLGKKVY